MKRIHALLTVACLSLAAQCSQPEAELPDSPGITPAQSFVVTPDEAAAKALAAREALSPATRSQAVAVSSVARHAASAAASDPAQVDPSLYVVNFADQGGFAIVAADRRQHATLYAVSDRGAFPDPATMEEGTLKFLFRRIETLAAAPSDVQPQDAVVVTDWKNLKTVGPHVKVCWGTGYPYRQSAFNVAICQIMSCHQWPQTFRWSIINQYLGIAFQPSADHLIISAVGYLFRTVDQQIKGIESTEQAFDKLGYLCDNEKPYRMSTVYDQIDLKRPVYAFGRAQVGCILYAYPWVMDGYLLQSRSTSASPGIETRTLFHCNLGNDGYGNGYYLSTLFDLNNPAYSDYPAWPVNSAPGQNSFPASGIGIITNIRPDKFSIPVNPNPPVTLESTVFVRP